MDVSTAIVPKGDVFKVMEVLVMVGEWCFRGFRGLCYAFGLKDILWDHTGSLNKSYYGYSILNHEKSLEFRYWIYTPD
jgi:hypothetical protein